MPFKIIKGKAKKNTILKDTFFFLILVTNKGVLFTYSLYPSQIFGLSMMKDEKSLTFFLIKEDIPSVKSKVTLFNRSLCIS